MWTILLVFLNLSQIVFAGFFDSIFYPKDEDADRTFCQLTEAAGFKCEQHYVTTSDGYILAVFRIVNNKVNSTSGKVTLFHHGLLASSTEFIMNAPGDGLANSETIYKNKTVSQNVGYALAMFGYDVWMMNCRGTYYSMNHTTLNPKLREFWKYSQDEIIKYDLPAVIDYILLKTNRTKMSYVGHSQGTTTLFGLLADNLKYNDKIDLFIAVTPVVKVEYSLALSVRMCMKMTNLLSYVGGHFPYGYKFGRNVDKLLVRIVPLASFFDKVAGGLVMGPFLHLNQSRAHVYLSHFGGASVWNGLRYLQDPTSFRKFDYGVEENIERYGSETPPEYDITKITTKVALISGTHDFLASVFDVDYVRRNLQNVVFDYVAYKQNHIDVLIGYNVAPVVKMILELLENT